MHLRRNLVLVTFLSAAVCGGLALAAKICGSVEDQLPSINADGSANYTDDLGAAVFQVCVNTKNGKYQAKGSGQTTNNSGRTQTFKNDPQLADLYFGGGGGITINRSKLRVKGDGSAKVLLKGVATLP